MKIIHLFLFYFSFISTSFSQVPNLLVGTYTEKGSKGIYLFHFDTATGKATEISHTSKVSNPSFLAITKDKQFVYAVNENTAGEISAFGFTPDKTKLVLINKVSTKGADPCHVTISPNQKNVFVANYSSGSLTSYFRFADGRLSKPQQFFVHQGKSTHLTRQEKAHMHGSFFSPDGNYLLATDLGADETIVFPYQAKKSPPLDVLKASKMVAKPGAGPRHLTFSSNGKWIYLLEELSGSISVYQFQKGKAILLQNVPLHSKDFNGQPGSADIHLSPDGKYIYASNRGTENNIVQFAVENSGKLNLASMEFTSTKGQTPRNFTISEDGKWLLVANQGSNNIVVFKRNLSNGKLTDTGNVIKVSMPSCLILF